MDPGMPGRAHRLEHRNSRRERRPPVKSLWSWILTMLLLGLIGLFLGIMFGGAISA